MLNDSSVKEREYYKIELRKVYGRKQNNWKSPAQKYMLDILVIDVLLVNEVFFLDILIPDWLV